MRTVPALYAADLIEWERAVANIVEATGAERGEAGQLLQDAAESDAWVVDEIGEGA
jgi:HD superfamily phosphohydrolase YqeK